MTQAVAVREVPLTPMRVDEVVGQVQLIQEIMRAVMRDGEHYGVIPGCGTKPSLLKPGAEKIMLTFRMVPDPEVTVHDLDHPTVKGHREYRTKVKLYARDGSYLGGGVGTCSTLETKYRYRTGPVEFTDHPVPREYWDLRKFDPVKAQALLGQGKVAKKNDAGQWMIAMQGGKVEHDNPADYYNTCEKMSKKRALVDATLTVTAASDIFTQDVEDFADEMKGQAKEAPKAELPKESPMAKEQKAHKPKDTDAMTEDQAASMLLSAPDVPTCESVWSDLVRGEWMKGQPKDVKARLSKVYTDRVEALEQHG